MLMFRHARHLDQEAEKPVRRIPAPVAGSMSVPPSMAAEISVWASGRAIYGHDVDTKQEDEPNSTTVDARGDNVLPLIFAEKDKALESPNPNGEEEIAMKPMRPLK
jgi:hypothetical protein